MTIIYKLFNRTPSALEFETQLEIILLSLMLSGSATPRIVAVAVIIRIA